MSIDPSVVAAIEAALEKDSESLPLRLYLASLLLHQGTNEKAMHHFTLVLAKDPANLDALKGAAAAASSLGDAVRAEGYRKLILSLGGTPGLPVIKAPPTMPTVPLTPISTDGTGGSCGDDDDTDSEFIEPEYPKVTLADVGGMENVKRRINLAFLAPLRNPKMREVYGKSLRGGLLLYGPPGCGKTFIAKAVAGDLQARFISIGITDIVTKWYGESEQKLHKLFENARRKQPTVIFFDEADAIGHKRSELRGGGGRNLVNTLLAELDGMDGQNTGVFVLAATNCPWDVDGALRRPGRFDRMVLVLPPDLPAREAILTYHLKSKPAEGIDVASIAKQTADFSGADLAYLCEAATESAMEDSLITGQVRPLSNTDFKKALREARPSTRAWFETAKNYAQFANEGGIYDELLQYLQTHKY